MDANTDKVKGRVEPADRDHTSNRLQPEDRAGRKLDTAKDLGDSIDEAARELVEGVENTVQNEESNLPGIC